MSNRRLHSHGYLADDSTSSLLEFASSALSFQALYEYLVSGFVSVYSRFFNERQSRLRMPGIHYCCSTYPSAHAVPYYWWIGFLRFETAGRSALNSLLRLLWRSCKWQQFALWITPANDLFERSQLFYAKLIYNGDCPAADSYTII